MKEIDNIQEVINYRLKSCKRYKGDAKKWHLESILKLIDRQEWIRKNAQSVEKLSI